MLVNTSGVYWIKLLFVELSAVCMCVCVCVCVSSYHYCKYWWKLEDVVTLQCKVLLLHSVFTVYIYKHKGLGIKNQHIKKGEHQRDQLSFPFTQYDCKHQRDILWFLGDVKQTCMWWTIKIFSHNFKNHVQNTSRHPRD